MDLSLIERYTLVFMYMYPIGCKNVKLSFKDLLEEQREIIYVISHCMRN